MSDANINDVLGRTQRENNAALERAEAELRQLRREVALLREVEAKVKALADGDLDPQYGPDAAVLAALKALEAAREVA